RIKALQQELAKFGYTIREEAQQTPTHWYLEKIANAHEEPTVETYEDHRMAMAFAPLATQQTITILAPEVVVKSYPNYWSDIHQVGVSMEENH
ncbi:MAG: 3-phosphoshikimate 1-carboxyvinyltransferase, partial [Bacteroidota bacterium]